MKKEEKKEQKSDYKTIVKQSETEAPYLPTNKLLYVFWHSCACQNLRDVDGDDVAMDLRRVNHFTN